MVILSVVLKLMRYGKVDLRYKRQLMKKPNSGNIKDIYNYLLQHTRVQSEVANARLQSSIKNMEIAVKLYEEMKAQCAAHSALFSETSVGIKYGY